MSRRVVITGLGVAAPNGVGIESFSRSMRGGISGISFHQELADLNFSCQLAGTPEVSEEIQAKYFTPLQLRGLKSSGIVYGVMAGVDAWEDAGFSTEKRKSADHDNGIIFGAGILGTEKFREAVHLVDAGNTKRLGSTTVVQTMASGISAYLGGMLSCGNQVTTNSSACTTGTEAVLMAYERIKYGKAEVMLAGSCSESGAYVWAGFDAMRILPNKYNNKANEASRPMSATACGFVPGSGAGALVLESLESAEKRGVEIYAEVLGGAVNSGGQNNGGSMTAANDEAIRRCIQEAVKDAGILNAEIDAINGHLTATSKDAAEIRNWCEALNRKGADFPFINSTKGLTGHCLSASGSIECVATVLQIRDELIYGNKNCEDLHPEIGAMIAEEKVPRKSMPFHPKIIAKSSFGFGDVNAVIIFGAYDLQRNF